MSRKEDFFGRFVKGEDDVTSPDCFFDADKENLSSPAPSCDNCFTTGHADGSSPDDLLDKGVDILDLRAFAGDCCGKDDAEFGSR